uniref:thiamine pyrophosphate-binding protein n=1 Tax=Polynucleobacter sp. TaxID=2029855 RepID=UPI00404783D6
MLRVADYIMQRLAEVGIDCVFHVTGRGTLFLTDALAKSTNLRAVSLHHEQSCAFAAIGYAEQSGKLGVCLVSTGCGSTNAITGVLSAWQDGIPSIFISGQNILRETTRFTGIPLRTYGQQEADIIRLIEPITKYAHMLTRPEQIVEAMDLALYEAQSGRKGPVWLDIPLDLQSALIDPNKITRKTISKKEATTKPSPGDVAEIVNSLNKAKRPIVLIGSGVKSAGAEAKLKKFIEGWHIPLTFTSSAPDTYGTANDLSIGSVGAMGCSRAGNFAIQNADFVLVLGSRLTSLNTGIDFCKFARAAHVVVLDIDPQEHSKKTIRIDKFVEGDIFVFLDLIGSATPKAVEKAWQEKCMHWKLIFSAVEPHFCSGDAVDLYQLANSLSALLPNPSTLITDSGLVEVILPSNIRFASGTKSIHPASQGAMGFALPASIGAQFAQQQLVIAVVGDGSIMMNLQELESIRYHKLPIKIIVINNNLYSIIRRRQRDLFRKRTIGTDPSNGVSCPDFSSVASCFGLKYMKIENTLQLDEGLRMLISYEGPVLCEIMGREDQGYIEVGQARSQIDNTLIRRPLEDQSPFIDREIFMQEMVIDPIDQ